MPEMRLRNCKAEAAYYHVAMLRRQNLLIYVAAMLLIFAALGGYASSRNAPNSTVRKAGSDAESDAIEPPSSSGERIELTTYRSPFGYEITYPTDWHTFDLTDLYYGDTYHYFSPLPINEDLLRRSLSGPVECDFGDPNGCSGDLNHYIETDYPLIDVLTREFDSDIVMPAILIPEEYRESTQEIVFPDGSKGVLWIVDTKNTRIIIVDGKKVRHHIVMRDPHAFGLDFTEHIVPILSSFRLTR